MQPPHEKGVTLLHAKRYHRERLPRVVNLHGSVYKPADPRRRKGERFKKRYPKEFSPALKHWLYLNDVQPDDLDFRQAVVLARANGVLPAEEAPAPELFPASSQKQAFSEKLSEADKMERENDELNDILDGKCVASKPGSPVGNPLAVADLDLLCLQDHFVSRGRIQKCYFTGWWQKFFDLNPKKCPLLQERLAFRSIGRLECDLQHAV